MDSSNILCVVCVLTLWKHCNTIQLNEDIAEYCMLETFNPKCGNNQVIVMTHAVYGRMRVGKCLKQDFILGCYVDILDVTDRKCSGQTSCNVFIPIPAFTQALTCLGDSGLTANLEAAFYCKEVYTPRSNKCITPEKIKVSKSTINLASKTSKDTSCGLQGSPWILEAEPGQQLVIDLLDFSWKNSSDMEMCPINYGYIMDMDSDDVINICGGRDRSTQLYLSPGHSVQVVLQNNAVERNNFILQFYAIGCPDYNPPKYSWIQKENESLVIGCVSSDKTWKLRCVDNRWLGMVGNCTSPPTPVVPAEITSLGQNVVDRHGKSSVQVPHISNNHVIVFTMACLTVLLCCVIVILGVYCIKRYDVKIKKYSKTNYNTIPTASFHNGQMTFSGMSTVYKPVSKQQNTIRPPAYTLTHTTNNSTGPAVPPRNNTANKDSNIDRNGLTGHSTYENVTDDAESVQYYILENPAESV